MNIQFVSLSESTRKFPHFVGAGIKCGGQTWWRTAERAAGFRKWRRQSRAECIQIQVALLFRCTIPISAVIIGFFRLVLACNTILNTFSVVLKCKLLNSSIGHLWIVECWSLRRRCASWAQITLWSTRKRSLNINYELKWRLYLQNFWILFSSAKQSNGRPERKRGRRLDTQPNWQSLSKAWSPKSLKSFVKSSFLLADSVEIHVQKDRISVRLGRRWRIENHNEDNHFRWNKIAIRRSETLWER